MRNLIKIKCNAKINPPICTNKYNSLIRGNVSKYVHKFITNKGFILENASLGRAGARPDGEPVMMIVMYSKDDQIIATVDIPTGESTCIITI